jgi:hypothetical protein
VRHEVRRSGRDVIVIGLSEFQGYPVVSFREWYSTPGGLRPGKKGIEFGARYLPAFASAIADALAALRDAGLAPGPDDREAGR